LREVTQLPGQPGATICSVGVVKKVAIFPSAVKDSPSACLQNGRSPADFFQKAAAFFEKAAAFPKRLEPNDEKLEPNEKKL
jgi:hypothetical protein